MLAQQAVLLKPFLPGTLQTAATELVPVLTQETLLNLLQVNINMIRLFGKCLTCGTQLLH